MTPTLDTAAIRRRFEQAIIGIRQDGTMAVLVPFAEGCDSVFDLVDGYEHYTEQFSDEFPTLIRPGDGVQVADDTLESEWFDAVYCGVGRIATGDEDCYPFRAYLSGDAPNMTESYTFIRPLPAAEPNSTDGCTCQDCGCVYKVDWLIPDALWQQIQDRGEGGLLCGSCIAARVEKLSSFNVFHFEPETVSDYPSGCPDRNTFTAAETNPLLSRLAAAEQELAAIRAEMERSAK